MDLCASISWFAGWNQALARFARDAYTRDLALCLICGLTLVCDSQSQVLKELMEDLEWPGSDVKIIVDPQPAGVTFLAQGHGDLQVCSSVAPLAMVHHNMGPVFSQGYVAP